MEQIADDENMMVQYLLGELPEEKQARFEERFFLDDEYFEQLLVVKDELIDDYVQGNLSTHEREKFERHFLTAPWGQQEVELTKMLMRKVTDVESIKLVETSTSEEPQKSIIDPPTLGLEKPPQPSVTDYALAAGMLALNLGWLVSGSVLVGGICFAVFAISSGLGLRWLYSLATRAT
jgi:hypothetical protein